MDRAALDRSLSITAAPAADDRQPNESAMDVETPSVSEKDNSSLNGSVDQAIGVSKIEALYVVFGRGWKMWSLWASIVLFAYVYTLSQSTTHAFASFATSSFGDHTIVSTISVITTIVHAVSQPGIAKIADLVSRPAALSFGLFFYTLGYIVTAASNHIDAVVAGQVLYNLGTSALTQVNAVLLADITPLQWRSAVFGANQLPWVINAFISGYITAGISGYSQNGWRWGYGMFCIIMPVCLAPMLILLFWAHHRAKKLGALTLTSTTHTRQKVLEELEAPRRKWWQTIAHHFVLVDGFGLLLVGFSFACLLIPATLSTTAKGGYHNPSLIAMLAVGGALFIAFLGWEFRFASYPIMPRRVMNRTFICCIIIDFFYFFTTYLTDTYLLSWVYIIKPNWSDRNYTYFSNIFTVGLSIFTFLAGLIQRYTHRYKAMQVCGLMIRCLAEGLHFYAVHSNPSDAVIVSARVLVSMGGAFSIACTQVAGQGSVPHTDMALAMAILTLWTQLGGSVASSIAGAVWNYQVPKRLEEYLGATHNATERAQIFGSIIVARKAEPHDLVSRAYTESLWGLFLGAVIVSFIGIFAGLAQKDFYLGTSHNSIETHKVIHMLGKDDVNDEAVAAKAAHVEEAIRQQVVQEKLGRQV